MIVWPRITGTLDQELADDASPSLPRRKELEAEEAAAGEVAEPGIRGQRSTVFSGVGTPVNGIMSPLSAGTGGGGGGFGRSSSCSSCSSLDISRASVISGWVGA